MNPVVSEITGYTIKEIMSMPDYPIPIVHEDDREILLRHINESFGVPSSGNNLEHRIICKNGRQKWLNISWRTIFDQCGKNQGHRSNIRDVTEHRQLREELFKSNQQFLLSQQAAQYGIWIADIQEGKMKWTKDLFRLFGLNFQEETPTFNTWFHILHPDDKEKAEEKIYESIKNGSELRNDYRVILPSGETRWFHFRGNTLYDDAGKPLRMLGICIDITEHKQAEEELRSHRENLVILLDEQTKELEKKTTELDELNTAVKVTLNQIKNDKEEFQANIIENINQTVEPYIKKIRACLLGKKEASYLNGLDLSLKHIISPFVRRLPLTKRSFTPTQIPSVPM